MSETELPDASESLPEEAGLASGAQPARGFWAGSQRGAAPFSVYTDRELREAVLELLEVTECSYTCRCE